VPYLYDSYRTRGLQYLYDSYITRGLQILYDSYITRGLSYLYDSYITRGLHNIARVLSASNFVTRKSSRGQPVFTTIKGTVSRDILLQVYFMNQFPIFPSPCAAVLHFSANLHGVGGRALSAG